MRLFKWCCYIRTKGKAVAVDMSGISWGILMESAGNRRVIVSSHDFRVRGAWRGRVWVPIGL